MLMFLAFSSTTNTLIIALMIPMLGVVSPLLVAGQINKNARATKEQDWARQDLVAERVAAVAEEAAKAATFVVQRQAVIDEKTDEIVLQVEKIHGLVNSQLTQAVKSELAATIETLAIMGEQMDQQRKTGVEPSTKLMEAYKVKQAKVNELEASVFAREEADAASKLVNTGPREVIIVNPPDTPVPVTDIPVT